MQAGKLDRERAILDEERRKQSLLKFFALFTTVKGISTSVKRRKFLDGVLKLLQKKKTLVQSLCESVPAQWGLFFPFCASICASCAVSALYQQPLFSSRSGSCF